MCGNKLEPLPSCMVFQQGKIVFREIIGTLHHPYYPVKLLFISLATRFGCPAVSGKWVTYNDFSYHNSLLSHGGKSSLVTMNYNSSGGRLERERYQKKDDTETTPSSCYQEYSYALCPSFCSRESTGECIRDGCRRRSHPYLPPRNRSLRMAPRNDSILPCSSEPG